MLLCAALLACVAYVCTAYASTFVSPWDRFGIAHYEVPGLTLAPCTGCQRQDTGICHIFLRLLQLNTSHTGVRGFLYMEAPELLQLFPTVTGGAMLQQQAPGSLSDVLHLSMRITAGNVSNSLANLLVGGTVDVRYPLTVDGCLASKALPHVRWLTVGALPRAASLTNLALRPSQEAQLAITPAERQVCSLLVHWQWRFIAYPLWGSALSSGGLTLLRTSIEWHLRLGFTEYIQYAYSAAPYLNDPILASWVSNGKLTLLSWLYSDTGFSRPYRAKAERYDKPLLYNHALLSHWGSGSYLFIADQDEFLATPQPVQQVAALLDSRGCLLHTVDQARLRRHDALCLECYSHREREIDRFSGTLGPATNFSQQTIAGETAVMTTHSVPPSQERLKLTTQGLAVNQMKGSTPHGDLWRLRMYGHVAIKDDHTKSLVNPDVMRQYHVHNGPVPYAAQVSKHYAPLDCLFVLHLKHLFSMRLGYNSVKGDAVEMDVDKLFVANTTWQWLLDA